MVNDKIVIRGAREHNLKDIDITIYNNYDISYECNSYITKYKWR